MNLLIRTYKNKSANSNFKFKGNSKNDKSNIIKDSLKYNKYTNCTINIKNNRREKLYKNKKIKGMPIIFFIVLLLNLLTLSLFTKIDSRKKLSVNSYIIVKIKKSGIFKAFHYFTVYWESRPPNEVYINGEQVDVKYEYTFNRNDNSIKLVWNQILGTAYNMFLDCYDISEIDLSNFDSSEITTMYGMFENCKSLAAINFQNFDTSKVTTMQYMFDDCKSLTSINLSNFNTKNVVDFDSMFGGCETLSSLDLSNFDTSNAKVLSSMFMFYSNLRSLDLSNFNTERVAVMRKELINLILLMFLI